MLNPPTRSGIMESDAKKLPLYISGIPSAWSVFLEKGFRHDDRRATFIKGVFLDIFQTSAVNPILSPMGQLSESCDCEALETNVLNKRLTGDKVVLLLKNFV